MVAAVEQETIASYNRRIMSYPRIDHAREIQLSRIIRRARNPKKVEAAVNEMVLANLRLVVHCLRDYLQYLDSPDICISSMDLVSEGNIALIAAARGFNAGYSSGRRSKVVDGTKFSTYACRCIRSRMQRALKLARLIHIPERHFTYRRRLEEIQKTCEGPLTDAEASARLGISVERINMVRLGRMCKVCRIEDFRQDGDQELGIDSLPARDGVRPDIETEKNDLMAYMLKEIDKLKPRTRMVITQLYLGSQKTTLQDLSVQLGLSKERCRQICLDGLRRMRTSIEASMEKVLGSGTDLGSERSDARPSHRSLGALIELLGGAGDQALSNVA